ncbi:MAG: hypothetical protein LGR52_12345 [Candidatus Thiosymbion ectosymbiont of Robbea hypermnestra]|nr:hypothetical protein [Candidatus Thiosymbion ectosymbiont of Robbea hypermnestra]
MTWERKPTPPYANRGARPADAIVEKCCPPAVTTGLGDTVDRALAKCPKFARNLQQLKDSGWKFLYGPKGKGSFCNRENTRIFIDGKHKGHTARVVGVLAHESGHALYGKPAEIPPDGLTREEYVARNVNLHLKDEGEAVLTNLDMRRCLAANDGMDIPIFGRQASAYKKIAAQYPDSKDRDEARQNIADLFGDREYPSTEPTQTYREYYGRPYQSRYDRLQMIRKMKRRSGRG